MPVVRELTARLPPDSGFAFNEDESSRAWVLAYAEIDLEGEVGAGHARARPPAGSFGQRAEYLTMVTRHDLREAARSFGGSSRRSQCRRRPSWPSPCPGRASFGAGLYGWRQDCKVSCCHVRMDSELQLLVERGVELVGVSAHLLEDVGSEGAVAPAVLELCE
jgi:hypothetical protein